MKSAPPELIALLNAGGPYIMADLYTISLIDGTILRYAQWDSDVTYGGYVFSCNGPQLARSKVRVVIGVQVDTMDMTVNANAAHTINGMPWLHAASRGVLDGATVMLERVFFSTPPAVVGGYINFCGRVADVSPTRTQVSLVVKSDLELLNVMMPRNLYQPGCKHTLYETDCGVNRASYAVAAVVQGGSTATELNAAALTAAAGYLDLGYIIFISGALTGMRRTIKSGVPGAVSLLNPLPQAPAVGDTFTAYPGCDKTKAACQNKFANLVHFRGFPFIPVPETTR